ncbi:MAG: 4Fe-4S binding protein [Candidatus Omnitrophota bacterium]|nr:4Fe-4S binding protein [Candidatus Omnitrophota bacterium]
MKRKSIFFFFFALGFFSLLAQTLVIREFIVSFGGNELGIGLFYFFWFFWVGIGSLVVLSKPGRFLYKHFLKIASVYPLLAFLEIVFFISLRKLAGLYWWEFFALERVLFYLFVFTALISFFTGMIFTLAVLWLKKSKEKEEISSVITGAYIFESLGSFAAGGIVTALIIKLTAPVIILLWASIIFTCACLLWGIFFKKKTVSVLNAVFLFVLVVTVVFLPQGAVNFFNELRLKNVFPEGEFVSQAYTPYQHIFLAKLKDQLIVLSGGQIISSSPDRLDADKESALFISQVPHAKNILILGVGAQDLIASLLKFPIEKITYCLEDKVYYDTVFKHLRARLRKDLDDFRLEVKFESPRILLRRISDNKYSKPEEKFDLIVVYPPDPSNLISNAFFTQEFYHLTRNNLTKKGVFATRITSAQNFIGRQIRDYGSSVYYTLRSVFPKIVMTPGKINWFLAGEEESTLVEDAAVLEDRFKKIKPDASSFPAVGFRSIFIKERANFIKEMYIDNALFKKTKLINTDARPLTFFLDILVMARYSAGLLVKFFKGAFFAGIAVFLVPFLTLFAARIWFIARCENIKSKRDVFNAKLYQFFSGFLGFSFHLCLIFLFQNRFGTIFEMIGLVNALFMLGLCGGGLLGKYYSRKISASSAVILTLCVQILAVILAYLIFMRTGVLSQNTIFVLFLMFFTATGILTGASYPLAARLLQDNSVSLVKSVGSLEILDHWGASCAGILTGLFMLPLLGVSKSLILLLTAAALLIFIFAIKWIPIKFFQKERTLPTAAIYYTRVVYVLTAVSICFLVISHLIERKKILWQDFDNSQSFDGKDYVLESKDYASGIKGFSGPINLKITLTDSKQIKEVKIIKHQETSSYIKNIDAFLSQFSGRRLEDSFDDIDTISGATVTSGAIIDIVNEVRNGILKQNRLVKTSVIKVDNAAWWLALLSAAAVALYVFFPRAVFLRKIYLVFVIVVLGFIFNIIFSLGHLSNLLTFNIFGGGVLSQILIYIIPVFLGLLLGQFWCGWLCPFGALQELLGSSRFCRQPPKIADKKARFFKYLFLAIVIIVVAITRGVDFFKQEPLSVFFYNPLRFSPDKILALAVLIFSVFFLRFWCRYFCPCGAFLSLFNKIALFGRRFIKRYKNCPYLVEDIHDIDCIQCNICNGPVIIVGAGKFFKLAFFFTLILMAAIFFSNKAVIRGHIYQQKKKVPAVSFQRIDYAKIKRLIAEDKLSDKESLFYKIIEK